MARELLQRAINSRDPELARAALEAAVRAGGDRLWVHRNVARLYREVFDDTPRARKVLEQLQPLTGVEWRLVAAAWNELGDRARATACLERAAKNARTSSDLCTIAMGYRDLGFLDEGRLMIDGAEAVVHRAIDYWTVAATFDAFDDRARGVEVLERGVQEVVDVIELVTLAHALASVDAGDERLASTLGRAERRVSTVDGWLAIATAYDQLTLDRAAALRCIGAASKLSTSRDHERAIGVTRARVTQLELLDDDRPVMTAAQRLRSGARETGWERDAGRLLGWVRARIPRTNLDGLTSPDQFFVNDGIRTLLEIQRSGAWPSPLPSYLENLYDVARGIGAGNDPLTRAFAGAMVCIEEATVRAPGGNEGLLAGLLATCIELGDGAVEAAIPMFAALADAYDATYSTTTATYHVLFAELALVLAAAWLDPSDPRLTGAIERLIRDEPRQRERIGGTGDWLLGLTPTANAASWRNLAREILAHDRFGPLLDRLA